MKTSEDSILVNYVFHVKLMNNNETCEISISGNVGRNGVHPWTGFCSVHLHFLGLELVHFLNTQHLCLHLR